MSVTNAISSIIILGALIAAGTEFLGDITILGGLGIFITSINIFGGFVVTQRMLRMYKK
jgi:NAD(P) transhydrogenase subunit alpha